MDNSAILTAIFKSMDKNPNDWVAYEDAFDCIRDMDGIKWGMAHYLQSKLKNLHDKERAYMLNRRILCYCAPVCTDDYALYMEMNRPYEKQFYAPRRKQLKPLADAMDRLDRRELKILGISMPPGTGKSTLAFFFVTRIGGRNPEKAILMGSHSNSFLRGAYGELLRFVSPDGDYLFNDVFPDVKIISTNAQDMMIDLGHDARDAKRFTTFELSSIGSGNAGKVRAENLLYCDDLVSDLEEAMSRERMDKKWESYSTDLRQRKIGDCAELHIATRWSVHDVIGRLARLYEDDPQAEFIVCPALDENDESNFDYPIPQGFTTQFYHEQRDAMDSMSWRALYMNEPVEREGQLYNENELRRYYELPDGEPDAIIAATDTKDTGKDFCCMLIAYQYGNDFYIEDVLYENFAPQIIDEQLVLKLAKHNVQMCQFESNAAGGRTADKVQERLKQQDIRTKITKKFTTANKDTKIIVNSPFVKDRFLFKETTDKEYRKFLNALCGYTMAGKNKNDDAPDCCAQLAEYIQNSIMRKIEIFARPW